VVAAVADIGAGPYDRGRMDRLLDDIGNAYDRGIVVPGREAHFLVLAGFLCSFGFIRTSAHLIHAQVSWWPGNVETKGGTHVHHLVWGILLLLVFGYVGVAVAPDSPWREIVAVLFGIGMGLTLDEFALWLNLEDVYWKAKGRQSIDAVVVAVALLTITLIGLSFWIDVLQAILVFLGVGREELSAGESTAVLLPLQLIGLGLALVCFLKGKSFTGVLGLFVPAVALVGAVRLAKPGSRWARRYEQTKLERAEGRFAGATG
jgi:hypothetical protein